MSLATHRAAIVAMVAAVANIGRVHDHQVYARGEAPFKRLYLWADDAGGEQVRGWFLRRVRTTETTGGLGRTINQHQWELKGFMSLRDEPTDTQPGEASELEFDALVEAVRLAYRQSVTLGGDVEPGPLGQPSGFQVTDSRPVMLAGVLCHSATLALTTYEYLDDGE